ncbi:MAG: hypothetical protein JSW37_08380 [Anaerolineales bacterium]|nr:MAG: hypothetical protein JSW37_08380 [Anaerolineales bacterium]
MSSRSRLLGIFVILILFGACAPAAPTIQTPVPTASHTPTAVPSPTAAATVPVPAQCPDGYSLYDNTNMGFSVCYPDGWLIIGREDQENELKLVTFVAPAGTEGAGLRSLSVAVTPVIAGYSDADFLQEIDNWLLLEYYDRLLTAPRIIDLDAHRAVDAAYEARVVLGREVVDVTRWVTALRAHDQRWFIDFVGRSQYRDELETIRGQFLSSLRILE